MARARKESESQKEVRKKNSSKSEEDLAVCKVSHHSSWSLVCFAYPVIEC